MLFVVHFSRNDNFDDIFVCMLLYLTQPRLHVVKSARVRRIVNQQDAVRALIITLSDCSKSFLASCVPNLQFNGPIVNLDRLHFEVDTYSRDMLRLKSVLRESQQ